MINIYKESRLLSYIYIYVYRKQTVEFLITKHIIFEKSHMSFLKSSFLRCLLSRENLNSTFSASYI